MPLKMLPIVETFVLMLTEKSQIRTVQSLLGMCKVGRDGWVHPIRTAHVQTFGLIAVSSPVYHDTATYQT